MRSVSENGAVLSIDALKRSFGSHEVVRDLDLHLAPGERVALWGPNGSGKSTVLRCIAGTLLPTEGEVRICGHAAGSLHARASCWHRSSERARPGAADRAPRRAPSTALLQVA